MPNRGQKLKTLGYLCRSGNLSEVKKHIENGHFGGDYLDEHFEFAIDNGHYHVAKYLISRTTYPRCNKNIIYPSICEKQNVEFIKQLHETNTISIH